MSTLYRDLRYGIRTLLNKPGFALAAAAVLALGIGANTAIFSLVNAFLLKPLVLEKPEQLAGCFSRDSRKPDSYRAFSYPNYVDLREQNTVFTSLLAHNMGLVGLTDGDLTRRVFADIVSSNYFATLGVQLYRGRAFTAAEERPGSAIPVAIVSYSFWQKKGSDPQMLGRTLRVNGRVFTVVGIAPEGFTGTTAMISPDLYIPLGMYEAVINDFEGHGRPLGVRDHHALILVGRLKPGLSGAAADAQLALAASRLEQAYPAENKDQTFIARPLSRLSISTRPQSDNQLMVAAALLLSMAGVVLLIASLNVANMMLARGAARKKEIAIRLALGAGRRNILQQLFSEGLILALLGGAAGLAVAYWSTTLLVSSFSRLAPVDIVFNGGPDLRVLAATMAFCVLSTLLFGLGPAFSLSKPDLVSDLKEGDNSLTVSGKLRRLFSRRNILVMSQISLSLALLFAAGLFVRSSRQVAGADPGFRLDSEVVAEVDPSLAGYDQARGREIYATLLNRLRGVPGVESASVAATVPFGMLSLGRNIQRAGDDPASPGTKIDCSFNMVDADYFKTLGIPLLRGRSFLPAEAAGNRGASVVVLDQTTAARLWPNGDALGQRVRVFLDDATHQTREAEVVGVVARVREHAYGNEFEPHLYVPFPQEYQSDMNIHLRVAASGREAEARMLETVRKAIQSVDNRMPILALKTLNEHLEGSFDVWIVRTGARMFAVFGVVALLVAMVGLYGVRAYTVARRTREIGIRMALGASAGDTLRMILREGLAVTAVGIGIGLALSLALGRVLSGFLFKVSGADPVAIAAAPLLLAGVSLLACYLPARRAALVDPITALRDE
ncbi:MAG: ABC transporter permease [Acidobacteriia bacterium]|nr:ABC transporter permease [Terriglobia bacterium]